MPIAVSLIAGPNDPEPRTVIFPDQGGVIGRSDGCKLVLPDRKRAVSKRHAFVERVGDEIYVTDLSTNGTFPFEKSHRIGRGVTRPIPSGGRILCGDYTLQLDLQDEAEDAASSEPETPAPPPPPQPLPAAAAGDPKAIVEGLLQGLAIDAESLDLSDPRAFGHRVGEILRQSMATVALAMRMRAHVKGSVHVGVTQLMPSQPNPLKISLNEMDALEAMLGPGHAQFQDPGSSLHDVQNELREHELAVLKAVRSSLHAVLKALDPEALMTRTEEKSGGFWPPKHQRAWDTLVSAYAELNDEDRLDSLFGKAYSAELKNQSGA